MRKAKLKPFKLFLTKKRLVCRLSLIKLGFAVIQLKIEPKPL